MTIDQQVALDEAIVPHASRLRIGKSNFHSIPDISSKESTLQLAYDVLRLTPFYKAFLVTADVLEIYMQEFWTTTMVHHHSIRFQMDNKKHIVNMEYFREMLNICPRFLEDFVYQVEHKDAKKSNEMYYPRFIKVIIHYFMSKDPLILRRNKVNWHYVRDDQMFTTIKLVSRHQNTQQFGAMLPIELNNEDIRNSEAYKEYYPSKSSKAKSLIMLSEVAMTEAEDLKFATKRSLQQTHISQASGSGADEGTGIILGVLDVPTKESDEEISWKSSDEEDNDDVDEGSSDQEDDDGQDDDDDQDDENKDDDDQDEGDDDDDQDEGNNDDHESNKEEEVYKATTDQLDWINPEGQQYPHNLLKPLPLISNSQGHLVIPFDHFINNDLEYLRGGASSRKYTTSVTKTKASDYGHIKWIEDLVYGFAINSESARDVYSKRRIIVVTEHKIVEWNNYKHLDWITLTNLTVEERFAFNVSFRMFKRSIVIQRRMEDLQLGVESYQKKLNLTRSDTYRSDLKRKEAYTAYSNPRGFIYQNKDKQNRLMRIDELHKFNDGTLNDVRTTLDDRLKGIRMKYLPQTIWRKSDKERAAAMIQAIDKQLKTRRIVRSFERFVGGRLYEGDFRMLQRTV
nr:hypothetical protein [Tanacetum cinerariifolium]